jgi:hypothetical protein
MRHLALVLAAAVVAGCAGAAPPARSAPAWSSSGAGDPAARSGLASEEWFPLVDGTILQYRTTSEGDAAGSGILPARAFRASARTGELRMPSGTRRFEYRPDGVATLNRDGVWVLLFELPIAPETTWRGEHGGTARWDAIDVAVEVPAGRFTGCARVREERGGDRPAVFATTFCPGTGVVLLEAMGGGAAERAELVYAGPPLDLGPDGLRRVP